MQIICIIMRTNIYKEKIIQLLKTSHVLSLTDLHRRLPKADFSTVYRNIKQLTATGEIKKIVLAKDNIVYELNNQLEQHDHFLCLNCGQIEEIQVTSKKLLTSGHRKIFDILIKGLCTNCNIKIWCLFTCIP